MNLVLSHSLMCHLAFLHNHMVFLLLMLQPVLIVSYLIAQLRKFALLCEVRDTSTSFSQLLISIGIMRSGRLLRTAFTSVLTQFGTRMLGSAGIINSTIRSIGVA